MYSSQILWILSWKYLWDSNQKITSPGVALIRYDSYHTILLNGQIKEVRTNFLHKTLDITNIQTCPVTWFIGNIVVHTSRGSRFDSCRCLGFISIGELLPGKYEPGDSVGSYEKEEYNNVNDMINIFRTIETTIILMWLIQFCCIVYLFFKFTKYNNPTKGKTSWTGLY